MIQKEYIQSLEQRLNTVEGRAGMLLDTLKREREKKSPDMKYGILWENYFNNRDVAAREVVSESMPKLHSLGLKNEILSKYRPFANLVVSMAGMTAIAVAADYLNFKEIIDYNAALATKITAVTCFIACQHINARRYFKAKKLLNIIHHKHNEKWAESAEYLKTTNNLKNKALEHIRNF